MRQPDGISVTGNSCSRTGPDRTGYAFPIPAKPRGGFWDMGKPVSSYTLPRLAPGEATSACCFALLGTESNWGVAVTDYKLWLDWYRVRCQGSHLTVEGAV